LLSSPLVCQLAGVSNPEPQKSDFPESRSGVWWGMWVTLSLLVLYALSVGPVVKLVNARGGRPSKALDTFYAPLEYAYDHSSAVKRFYDWYFRLWGVK